uniref:Uncharacterized protein n=1 Tax=Pan paniscus TaxID=9597 RepID=A0A2R8ZH16_PANPA
MTPSQGPFWAFPEEAPKYLLCHSPSAREGPEARSVLKPHPLLAQVLPAGLIPQDRRCFRTPSLPHTSDMREDTRPGMPTPACLNSPGLPCTADISKGTSAAGLTLTASK